MCWLGVDNFGVGLKDFLVFSGSGWLRVLKDSPLDTGTLSWDFGCLVGVAVRFLGDSSGLLDWGALSHVPLSASVVGG